mmetsp:Transcript_4497/g.13146  ORF Transcript_4497/g.13146 Transcript_4497/m.13146 type:complete len:205 (-) Transcript_4497:121-735(-)
MEVPAPQNVTARSDRARLTRRPAARNCSQPSTRRAHLIRLRSHRSGHTPLTQQTTAKRPSSPIGTSSLSSSSWPNILTARRPSCGSMTPTTARAPSSVTWHSLALRQCTTETKTFTHASRGALCLTTTWSSRILLSVEITWNGSCTSAPRRTRVGRGSSSFRISSTRRRRVRPSSPWQQTHPSFSFLPPPTPSGRPGGAARRDL